MQHFNESSRPMIEITISRTALRRCIVVLPLSFLLLLGVIGAAVSPLVNGHPVFLTRERRALNQYLDEAQGWIQRFEDIALRLDALSPAPIAVASGVLTTTFGPSITLVPTGSLPAQLKLPSQTPLSVFDTPASQPTNLFDRAQAAEQVIQELQMLERDLQQIETPVAFNGLQDIAAGTVQAFATWSTQVMNALGAPSVDAIITAQNSRKAALNALDTLRQTLAQQQGLQP